MTTFIKYLKQHKWKAILVVVILTLCAALNVLALSKINEPHPVGETAVTSSPTVNNRRICLHVGMIGDDWPVPQAAEQWNKNGKNIFILVDSESAKNERCDGLVIIHVEDTGAYWGVTQHTGSSAVRLGLSSRVPLDKRLHVLCHELGHVLGLPHFETSGESCMDLGTGALQLYNPSPTALDLSTVGQSLWDWDKARQSASR